jgi:hypothetical protein
VLPLLVFELLNRDLDGKFPVPLFAVLWVLPFAFVLLFPSVIWPSTCKGAATQLRRLATTVCLLGIALLWGAIVLDQMPCFLGVPNCD